MYFAHVHTERPDFIYRLRFIIHSILVFIYLFLYCRLILYFIPCAAPFNLCTAMSESETMTEATMAMENSILVKKSMCQCDIIEVTERKHAQQVTNKQPRTKQTNRFHITDNTVHPNVSILMLMFVPREGGPPSH